LAVVVSCDQPHHRLVIAAVCLSPPARSKWNKVEHRFSFISSNWRGEPLRDYETVVRLIAGTTTAKGLKVTCRLITASTRRAKGRQMKSSPTSI